ncbi:S46 family peptidase [Terrimonas ferruginea]|uniref:S46 family peptidase n=1 Tax=Terrimonas ferruginea TaxID=249 RepID=UPI00048FCCB7|nr:S46 family peptidase [Terrimonas ferruginea]
MKVLKLFLLAFVLFFSSLARADEGMWLPLLLEKLNEQQMKSLGMKISARDIYSVNNGSLKDAIVSFGGFCTGEVISSKGLVLTNHHCGFDAIQNHSTLDNNYIRDGFWARNYAEEIPNQGLFVTFIARIEDVSKLVLNGVTSGMSEKDRQALIEKNMGLVKNAAKRETYQDAFIRGFFEGNQYYMFVTETYNDVRLVGAPPSSIGNFGKDTDNWMWPRHTGDFSLFRIYAGKDNKPAAYSTENVPFVPKKSLSISLDGTAKGDFTMIFGFPGRTTEYLPAAAVKQIVEVNDPTKIAIRDKALAVIDGFMRNDEQIKIQYAAKYASIANAWKKWQGEVLGLNRTDGVGKKKKYEEEFNRRVLASAQLKQQYGTVLGDLEKAYAELYPYGIARDIYGEIIPKIELFTVIQQLKQLKAAQNQGETAFQAQLPKTKERLREFYKEYDSRVDVKLFEALMPIYIGQDSAYSAPSVRQKSAGYAGDYARWAQELYKTTVLADENKVLEALDKDPAGLLNALTNDPAVALQTELAQNYSAKVLPRLTEIQARINALQRTYMQAQMDVMTEKKFYPDANSTLRVTYGTVKGYEARDAVAYDIHTYLDGVMEKYVPGDYEFDVPAKLRELYQKKDYGQYGAAGKMPVCFIAANHTTGGNSGSPALDAYGNLVGLNFDRVWEGTMSDINYDPSICRNIMVDIRYVLFIIDKYAGAGHLVKEMKLVHPKKKK